MSNKGLCEVTRGQKYWVAVLRKKGWGIGILREYMYFPVFWDERYAIQKIKTGMHGCVQLDACNWWDGGGIKGTCRGDMRLLCWKLWGAVLLFISKM